MHKIVKKNKKTKQNKTNPSDQAIITTNSHFSSNKQILKYTNNLLCHDQHRTFLLKIIN